MGVEAGSATTKIKKERAEEKKRQMEEEAAYDKLPPQILRSLT